MNAGINNADFKANFFIFFELKTYIINTVKLQWNCMLYLELR
jgi:hypothetical protein